MLFLALVFSFISVYPWALRFIAPDCIDLALVQNPGNPSNLAQWNMEQWIRILFCFFLPHDLFLYICLSTFHTKKKEKRKTWTRNRVLIFFFIIIHQNYNHYNSEWNYFSCSTRKESAPLKILIYLTPIWWNCVESFWAKLHIIWFTRCSQRFSFLVVANFGIGKFGQQLTRVSYVNIQILICVAKHICIWYGLLLTCCIFVLWRIFFSMYLQNSEIFLNSNSAYDKHYYYTHILADPAEKHFNDNNKFSFQRSLSCPLS